MNAIHNMLSNSYTTYSMSLDENHVVEPIFARANISCTCNNDHAECPMCVAKFCFEHCYYEIQYDCHDTWISFFDKISEHILHDNKYVLTGHYNHNMYYIVVVSKTGSNAHVVRCSDNGTPFEIINNDYEIKINFSLKHVSCCDCVLIHNSVCTKCGRYIIDEKLAHSLLCGHEIVCLRCATKLGKIIKKCPFCLSCGIPTGNNTQYPFILAHAYGVQQK